MKRTHWLATLMLLSVALWGLQASAAPPPLTMTQQGRIVVGGVALTGVHDIQFTFENVTVLEQDVMFENGFYSVVIDDQAAVAKMIVDAPVTMSIAVEVEDDGVLTPLEPAQTITSVPYALVAATVECDGCIDDTTIASGAIRQDHIGPGAVGSDELGQAAVTYGKIGVGAVTRTEIEDGTITADDIDGGLYSKKTHLYVATNSETLPTQGALTVSAQCADANDLPLSGSCPADAFSGLEVKGFGASNWESNSNPAEYSCTYFNTISAPQTTVAEIVCVSID